MQDEVLARVLKPVVLRGTEFHASSIRLDEGEIIGVREPFRVGLGEIGEGFARVATIGPLVEALLQESGVEIVESPGVP